MTTRDYLRVLGRRWRLLTLFVVLGIAGGVAVTTLTPATYRANTALFVSTDATSDQTEANSGNSFAQSRVKSYLAIVTSPDVLSQVQADLRLTMSQQQLAKKISASAATDSLIITISASDASATTAAAIANSTAAAFTSVVREFETPTGTTTSTVKVLVTSPALAPTSPVSPNPVLDILLAALIGLVLGISGAALREVLDNAVRAPEDLAEASGSPLLGAIVSDTQATRQPVAARVNARGPRAEGFRQLRTNLQFIDVDQPPRVIAVNSAVPGEGKTSTAVNIAAALAEGGQRVCLIDADLRRPTIADVMGLVGTVGLTNVLIGQVPLAEAYQDAGSSLVVLTSGPLPPNPSELLGANQMRELIRRVAAEFDYVIIDTAPLLPVADGAEVAAAADGSILVSRWGLTSFPQVRRSVEALERVDARLLGVVLNRVPGRHASAYGYTYYGKRPVAAGHRHGTARQDTAVAFSAPAAEPTAPAPPEAVVEPEETTTAPTLVEVTETAEAVAETETETEPVAAVDPEVTHQPGPWSVVAAADPADETPAEAAVAEATDDVPLPPVRRKRAPRMRTRTTRSQVTTPTADNSLQTPADDSDAVPEVTEDHSPVPLSA